MTHKNLKSRSLYKQLKKNYDNHLNAKINAFNIFYPEYIKI